MKPLEALQTLYNATRSMSLSATEHEVFQRAAVTLDSFITAKLKEVEVKKQGGE